MSAAKHTPGPWRTHWNGVYGHMIEGGDDKTGNVVIGVLPGISAGLTTQAAKANALLAAGAPALAKTLFALLNSPSTICDPALAIEAVEALRSAGLGQEVRS